MSIGRRLLSLLLPACGLAALILDSKTALHGAMEGIELCIQSVIPSLFPFFILSILLTNAVLNSGRQRPNEHGVLPQPFNALFLAGLLGGYPTGAQSVAEAYRSGNLSKDTAHRMLGFCSNAGPAFIFGITSQLFTKPYIPWIIWLIHILSAVIVAVLIPVHHDADLAKASGYKITLQQAFSKSLHAIASVCGWIILFRVLISFCDKWFLWLFPQEVSLLITGVLELTNGIFQLQNLESEGVRFIYCSVLLAFGGICVVLQTASVTAGLGLGWYFPGKLTQSAISGILSVIAATWIYCLPLHTIVLPIFVGAITLLVIVFPGVKKFYVAFSRKFMYNG